MLKEDYINLINNFIITGNLNYLYQALINYVEDNKVSVSKEKVTILFNAPIIMFIIPDIVNLITGTYKINEIYKNNNLIKVY